MQQNEQRAAIARAKSSSDERTFQTAELSVTFSGWKVERLICIGQTHAVKFGNLVERLLVTEKHFGKTAGGDLVLRLRVKAEADEEAGKPTLQQTADAFLGVGREVWGDFGIGFGCARQLC